MIFRWSFVTVTVVTVLFLRVSILNNIYITIYISDIYNDFKRGYTPHFLTVTTVTVTLRCLFTFLPFYLFLYEALECPHQFVAHAESEAHRAEVAVHLYRAEVHNARGDRSLVRWRQIL